jgi:hypothetical protein
VAYGGSTVGGSGPAIAGNVAHDNRGGASTVPSSSSATGGGPGSAGGAGAAGKATTSPDAGQSSQPDAASKLSFLTTVSKCGGFQAAAKPQPYTWYKAPRSRPLEWALYELHDAGTADADLAYCDAEFLRWSCDAETGLTLQATRQLNNCCGQLDATLEPEGDAYRMKVVAVDGMCDCVCVFDVEVSAPHVPCVSRDLILDLPRSRTPTRATLPLAEGEGQVVLSTEATYGICRPE